ncbi:DUF6795 domain-containing protein [Vibrio alginolyticus]|uniref:DUF6795 domain-containing protein n=1 Tax=Vibrio alginolyticus TaxID=663 RepID=UPI00301CC27D
MNFEESKLNDEHVNQYTPKINGVLTKKGKPLSSLKVSLSIGLSMSGKSIDLSTFTDSTGRFEFSPVYENKDVISTPLIENYVNIVLVAELSNDESTIIWEGSFDGYKIEDYVKITWLTLLVTLRTLLSTLLFQLMMKKTMTTT